MSASSFSLKSLIKDIAATRKHLAALEAAASVLGAGDAKPAKAKPAKAKKAKAKQDRMVKGKLKAKAKPKHLHFKAKAKSRKPAKANGMKPGRPAAPLDPGAVARTLSLMSTHAIAEEGISLSSIPAEDIVKVIKRGAKLGIFKTTGKARWTKYWLAMATGAAQALLGMPSAVADDGPADPVAEA